MRTSQEIEESFNELSVGIQNSLLEELLMGQELQGKVMQEAGLEISKARLKKPCPNS